MSPSRYPHEREGLEHVRDQLPDASPYHAWTNFEFVALDGSPYEVDLLVLGPAGFHLVELKAWSGTIRGDELEWQEHNPGAGRVITRSNPLGLTRRKAQAFRSWLEHHARREGGSVNVPFVHESLFLHGQAVDCRLPERIKQRVFGRDDVTGNHLRRIVLDRLTMPPGRGAPLGPNRERALVELLKKTGVRRQTRELRAGSWVLDPEPVDSGWGWHDNIAHHDRFSDEVARVRRWFVPAGSSAGDEAAVRRAAEREYRMLRGLDHPGLVSPNAYLEMEGAVAALVYDYDPDAVTLDRWVERRGGSAGIDTKLDLLAGLAEVIRYAHEHGLVHRGLSPSSVLVTPGGEVRVKDWQTAGSADPTTTTETHHARDLLVHDKEGHTALYAAPETVMGGATDRKASDVFSLGALAYLVLTGVAPADEPVSLRQRLQRDGGLDVSAVMDAPPRYVADLVLEATRPVVSSRTASVEDFVAGLDLVLEELTAPEEPRRTVDPLDAQPGDELEGGLSVVRRLGEGATSKALLVRRPDGTELVLKAARDDSKARRLHEEAAALQKLPGSNLVANLVEGPVEVGGRTCLLVGMAGQRTLAAEISRGRLTLDRLRRWGRDLLEIVALLEHEGVVHRDIKPANLGVVTRKSDGQPHLVLFDFSLSGVPSSDLEAGTAGYRDPFLGAPARRSYDLAAETFSASVTLHEMATGALPRWGDGRTDPAMLHTEVALERSAFDETVADGLVTFFSKALARDAGSRFHNPQDMARAWDAVFIAAEQRESSRNPEEEAARATLTTPLPQSGLSAKALSALEQYVVATVKDLLDLPPLELSRISGAAQSTKDEVVRLAKQWRRRLVTGTELQASGVDALVQLLLPAGDAGTVQDRVVRLMLGQVDPLTQGGPLSWPTAVQVENELDVTRAEVTQAWQEHLATLADRPAVAALHDQVLEILDTLRGTAVVDELALRLLDRRGSHADEPLRTAQTQGLVRVALELPGTSATTAVRRTGDRVLVTGGPDLDQTSADENLDAARLLGQTAETLCQGDALASPATVQERLRETAEQTPLSVLSDSRLLSLAAAAGGVAVSARGELYPPGMSAARALRLAGGALVAGASGLHEATVRARVRSRFPEAQELPNRPELTRLIEQAGLDLHWNGDAYAPKASLTGAASSVSSTWHGDQATGDLAAVGARLERSLKESGFLALSVPHRYAVDAQTRLLAEHDLVHLDLNRWLLERLRELASSTGADWQFVLRADSKDRHDPQRTELNGIVRHVAQALPELVNGQEGPVLLTGAGVLARHGCVDLLQPLAALDAARPHAVWLLVPRSSASFPPTLDGQALPLAAPTQAVEIPIAWAVSTPTSVPA
ncbi:BREX system serine/threonine kinase PglW [Nocardioides sp. WL0053]|uniref:non-specific serine/threonine protein kinase n=1 Tax=Nocardioides jiangsuensis TaxID=2866161 RepID=A0ABS7RLS2_9ACTN|nr:BREX system serine/threonine kinase PglW [Nocardioides jiangsuensis]